MILDQEERERPRRADDPGGRDVRRILLALVAFGIVGLGSELVLLEHFEEAWQWTPFITMGFGLASLGWVAFSPSPTSIRTFRVAMGLVLLAGFLGLWFHYRSNMQFEVEMDPDATGWPLIWAALRGGTPALAPGAMLQIGLLGLVAVYRHPVFQRDAPDGAHHLQPENA